MLNSGAYNQADRILGTLLLSGVSYQRRGDGQKGARDHSPQASGNGFFPYTVKPRY